MIAVFEDQSDKTRPFQPKQKSFGVPGIQIYSGDIGW